MKYKRSKELQSQVTESRNKMKEKVVESKNSYKRKKEKSIKIFWEDELDEEIKNNVK